MRRLLVSLKRKNNVSRAREVRATKMRKDGDGFQRLQLQHTVETIRADSSLRLPGASRSRIVHIGAMDAGRGAKRKSGQWRLRRFLREPEQLQVVPAYSNKSFARHSNWVKVPAPLAMTMAFEDLIRASDIAKVHHVSTRVVGRCRDGVAYSNLEYQMAVAEFFIGAMENESGRLDYFFETIAYDETQQTLSIKFDPDLKPDQQDHIVASSRNARTTLQAIAAAAAAANATTLL